MTTEIKIKILVHLSLWISIIWFLWYQILRITIREKRIKIHDKCNTMLVRINKLNNNPDIDKDNIYAKNLRKEAKSLWREYENLQKRL